MPLNFCQQETPKDPKTCQTTTRFEGSRRKRDVKHCAHCEEELSSGSSGSWASDTETDTDADVDAGRFLDLFIPGIEAASIAVVVVASGCKPATDGEDHGECQLTVTNPSAPTHRHVFFLLKVVLESNFLFLWRQDPLWIHPHPETLVQSAPLTELLAFWIDDALALWKYERTKRL